MESKPVDKMKQIDAHVKGVLKHIKRIPTLSSQPEKKATLVKRVWEFILLALTTVTQYFNNDENHPRVKTL